MYKIINKKGIINIGGKKQTIYNFAKNHNKKIKKALAKKNQIHLNVLKNKKTITTNIQSRARTIRYDLLTNFCKKNIQHI